MSRPPWRSHSSPANPSSDLVRIHPHNWEITRSPTTAAHRPMTRPVLRQSSCRTRWPSLAKQTLLGIRKLCIIRIWWPAFSDGCQDRDLGRDLGSSVMACSAYAWPGSALNAALFQSPCGDAVTEGNRQKVQGLVASGANLLLVVRSLASRLVSPRERVAGTSAAD